MSPGRDDTFDLDGTGAGDEPANPAVGVLAASQGRYRQESVLGEGGMGRVTSVRDQVLHRAVALKALKPNSGTAARERFLREARVTARLEHPNIVPVHELGRGEDGALYYTMKQVGGGSLGEAIAARSTLDERLELLVHFVDLCQAVAYAHDQGVLHRDLKPANVMVGAYGETLLLDWGLARVDGETETAPHQTLQQLHPSHTLDGSVMGTAAYMSPEQARGEQASLDARSDVWSLGMVLYELLSGEPPFRGLSTEAILEQVQQARVPPLPSQVPAELASVMERCLAARPEDRYATALAVADEVEAWRTGGWVRAHRYGLWQRLVRRLSRNPSLTAALAALALVLAITGAVLGVLLARTDAALQSTLEAESRYRQATRQAEVMALLERSQAEQMADVPSHALALAWAAWERSGGADAQAAAALRRLSPAAAFELQPHDQGVQQVLLFGSTVLSSARTEVVASTTAGEQARVALDGPVLVRAGERVFTVEPDRVCLREVPALTQLWCRMGVWSDVAPSPDGRSVLLAGQDSLVRVRVADGVDELSLDERSGAVTWSADSSRVLTVPGTNLRRYIVETPPPLELAVRDAETLEVLRSFPVPGPVVGLAADPTLRWVVLQQLQELPSLKATVWLVDLQSLRTERVAELEAFVRTERVLPPPSGSDLPGVLLGALLFEERPTGWMSPLSISPISLNRDAGLSDAWLVQIDHFSLFLLDRRDRWLSEAIPVLGRALTAVDVSERSGRLAVGAKDGTVQIREGIKLAATPGDPSLDLRGLGDAASAPIAAGDRSWWLHPDRHALVRQDAMGDEVRLEGPSDDVVRWLGSDDGQWLAGASAGGLDLWNPGTGKVAHALKLGSAPSQARLPGSLIPSFSADGRCATTLRAGADQRTVALLELPEGTRRTLDVDAPIAQAWLGDSCDRLVGIDAQGEAGTWDRGAWHGWGVSADWMRVAPDGASVVGGEADGPTWWRALDGGQPLATLPPRIDVQHSVANDDGFSPNGQVLALRDGRAVHLLHSDGRRLQVEHDDTVQRVTLSDRYLAAIGGEHVRIWDLARGQLLVEHAPGLGIRDALGRSPVHVDWWWSGEDTLAILSSKGHIERIPVPPEVAAAAEQVARSTNLRVCATDMRVVRDPEPGPTAWAQPQACAESAPE